MQDKESSKNIYKKSATIVAMMKYMFYLWRGIFLFFMMKNFKRLMRYNLLRYKTI
jgi:hypothetical protein